jgi:hypothetical protein
MTEYMALSESSLLAQERHADTLIRVVLLHCSDCRVMASCIVCVCPNVCRNGWGSWTWSGVRGKWRPPQTQSKSN